MKKIIAVLILALFLAVTSIAFFGGVTAKIVNAEEVSSSETVDNGTNQGENLGTGEETEENGQIPNEDTNEPTSPEETPNNGIVTEDGKITITKEELTEIINSALNEQQKQLVDNLAGKIASALGLEYETVYLVCGGIVLVVLVVIILLAYVFKGKGSLKALNTQLKAQQSAYSVLSESKEDLLNVLKSFSTEEIGAMIQANLKTETEKLSKELSADIINKLKIDENTLSELLGNEKILVTQVKLLSEALIAIASNNRDVAINILSKAPTTEAVNELTIENAKLKTALGEKAVADTLANKKTTNSNKA